MNIQEIEKAFGAYKMDYDPYFSSRLNARLQRKRNTEWNWAWLSPALGLAALCLAILLVQDGSLSVDSLLGVENYDTELQNYLMYF